MDGEEEGTGELAQLDHPDLGFDRHEPTIAAGTLLDDSRIVQVGCTALQVPQGMHWLRSKQLLLAATPMHGYVPGWRMHLRTLHAYTMNTSRCGMYDAAEASIAGLGMCSTVKFCNKF